MGKESFNEDWICYPLGQEEEKVHIRLPHDAMQMDKVSNRSASGENNGWYEARDYIYEKKFYVPKEQESACIYLEFEGIYHGARVFLNDEEVACDDYGYLGIITDITETLQYGRENLLRVEVRNSDQPNSRWYTGTGIYRPVWIYFLPESHIRPEGIRITTLDLENRKVRIQVETVGGGTNQEIRVEVLDGEICMRSISGICNGHFVCEFDLSEAELWDTDHPQLYTCKVVLDEDIREVDFGIRMVSWGPKEGFLLNGKRVILKGACIHHDNGLLGACAYWFAEDRKIKILKEQGFNAIRSAHNPCSKALLEACDRRGMLVLDEYVDVWYIHKTRYDYADCVQDNYRDDLRRMVEKDYNHPSVIMYSIGNEVSETAQKKGIRMTSVFCNYLHQLDPGRPVTCGINIFFNFLSRIGLGVYSDQKAEKEEGTKRKRAVGSEFYNRMAGVFGAGFMKLGAALYPCDLFTRGAYEVMDIAGYNYGILRYLKDLKRYPNRLILGTETFCRDAYLFWKIAKENPRIIGDFVWTGMDYLGEVGVGAWEYKDYASNFSHGPGWVSAGSGRIDLTGKALTEMKYMQVVFEERIMAISVIPVYQAGQRHSPSAWKMSNGLESWSFHGCCGKKTTVEIYARAHHVKLFLNGICKGEKKVRGCRVKFSVRYEDGELMAVAYDADDQMIDMTVLRTAGDKTVLWMEPEQKVIEKESGLCYMRLRFADEKGIGKPMIRDKIHLSVEGGEILGFGSACPFYPNGYHNDTADTYYGEALAIIRPTGDRKIKIMAFSSYGNAQTEIQVV